MILRCRTSDINKPLNQFREVDWILHETHGLVFQSKNWLSENIATMWVPSFFYGTLCRCLIIYIDWFHCFPNEKREAGLSKEKLLSRVLHKKKHPCWFRMAIVLYHIIALVMFVSGNGPCTIWLTNLWIEFDRELDEGMRDAFHNYIEERGINESLFKFLQAWLYVKEHRNLMRWFKTMGLFIDGKKPATGA